MTPGCGKPAKLQCPKCIQLKLAPAHFCSQECFKGFWNVHKIVHDAATMKSTPEVKLPAHFDGFEFTGPLRPVLPYSPKREVPKDIPRPEYADSGIPIRERGNAVEIQHQKTIESLRKCCKIAREVLDIAGAAVKVGITTDELDKIVHEEMIKRGAYPSPLNYRGFPKSVCTSVNEVICHGIPDSRPLQDGDIVNIDVTAYFDGVHGDLNETFLVGNVDDKGRELVRVTKEALDKAIEIVKPGTLYREVGNVIEKHVKPHGFQVVRSYCGHGIGKIFHTTPSVPHYAKNKAVGVMKAGHVFTIEPMINEGTWQDYLWPDDWTSTTKDGKRSAQFEHTILVTETGCEVLTAKK